MKNQLYSVIDFETTGVYAKVDRIIEVAVMKMDSSGNKIGEYFTLVNPQRDVSAFHIHGISAKDVVGAPVFSEIAGNVLDMIHGTIIVAHNAIFDVRFLDNELKRMGYSLPGISYICTMHLASKIDAFIPGRKLGVLCDYFNIELGRAHTALDDVRATGKLFQMLLAQAGRNRYTFHSLINKYNEDNNSAWPALPASEKCHTRGQYSNVVTEETNYISKLVQQLPAMPYMELNEEAYVMVLDKVLEDRRISSQEFSELHNVASENGISQQTARQIHLNYIRELIRVALIDAIITENERKDLEEVRELLAIPQAEYKKILAEEIEFRKRGQPKTTTAKNNTNKLENLTVCFTGEMACRIEGEIIHREDAQRLASEAGMIVKIDVTKKLDLLVTRDPYSLSGKAKKARQYGVRIVAEPVFWRILGIDVE